MTARVIVRLAILALATAAALPAQAEADDARGTTRLPKVRLAPDGSGFLCGDKPLVPFGLTYFRPHTGWAPQLWKQFDATAVRADFGRMKALGVTVARVFLSYGSFTREPGKLNPEGLAKLDQLLAIAEDAGIYVHPTGLDHWEGTPAWARGDRFADERLLQAQEKFWTVLASRYRGRSVIWAYDLLNEPSVRWDGAAMQAKWNGWLEQTYPTPGALAAAWKRPVDAIPLGSVPIPDKSAPASPGVRDYQRFRESVADEWTRRQAAVIRAADPQALVTVGFIQWSVPLNLAGSWQYAAFRPDRQAQWLDFLEVHGYPLDGGAYHYGGPEAERRNLAYLDAVVREAARPGKPVVVAECGWYGGGKPTLDHGTWPAASEADQARWCEHLIQTTAGSAIGWLNWGLYDHPEARDVTQLSGLLTADGRIKAWGTSFTALSAGLRANSPRFQKPSGPFLDWDACTTDAQARAAARERVFREFTARRLHE